MIHESAHVEVGLKVYYEGPYDMVGRPTSTDRYLYLGWCALRASSAIGRQRAPRCRPPRSRSQLRSPPPRPPPVLHTPTNTASDQVGSAQRGGIAALYRSMSPTQSESPRHGRLIPARSRSQSLSSCASLRCHPARWRNRLALSPDLSSAGSCDVRRGACSVRRPYS